MGLRPALVIKDVLALPSPNRIEMATSLSPGARAPGTCPSTPAGRVAGQPDPLFFDRAGCRFTLLYATVVLSQPIGEKLFVTYPHAVASRKKVRLNTVTNSMQ